MYNNIAQLEAHFDYGSHGYRNFYKDLLFWFANTTYENYIKSKIIMQSFLNVDI